MMRFRNVSARWLIVRAKLTLLISWQEMFVCLRESRDRKEFNLRSGVPLFSRREKKNRDAWSQVKRNSANWWLPVDEKVEHL